MTVEPSGRRLIHGLLVITVASACAEPSSGPSVGSIEVAATTSGSSPDPDGYQVKLNGEPARPLAVTATVLYPSLPAGEYRLVLGGIAANCKLAGEPTRSLTVIAGETATVDFTVSCSPTSGSIVIRTVSTGDDVDPNGYTVVIDDSPQAEVPATGTAQMPVTEGEHSVSLAGVTPNCDIEGENPRRVTVATGADVPTTFAITCAAAAPAGPGSEIAFVTNRVHLHSEVPGWDVAMMNTDGAGVRLLLSARGPLSWSREAGRLAVGTGSSILLGTIDQSGSFLEQDEIAGGEHTIFGFSWSPDGRELAYSVAQAETAVNAEIRTVAVDGTGGGILTCGCFDVLEHGSPEWSPDGVTIAVPARGLIFSDVDYWIDDGIWLFDPAGAFQQPFDPPPLLGTTPAWSPDGAQIALGRREPGSPDYDIFMVNSDGSNPVRLTESPGDDSSPTWSPDGSRLAFVSHRDGNAEIYVMERDGSNPTRITNNPAADTLPAWRP